MCVQEAAAIIAQRTSNPREFFKQKEKAVTSSLDTSPIMSHRTGKTTGRNEGHGGKRGEGNERNIPVFLWGKNKKPTNMEELFKEVHH